MWEFSKRKKIKICFFMIKANLDGRPYAME